MKKIDIICPLYNEAQGIVHFNQELWKVLDSIKSYEFQVIYIADGCTDNTWELLSELAKEKSNIMCLSLSKRYGHQAALVAGMDHATGDALITMDADMQHPPSVIPLLLQKFEDGNQIVYTLRKDNERISFFKQATSRLFYKCINLISDIKIPEGAADFRLLSKKVYSLFQNNIREHGPFLRGLTQWVGFQHDYVTFKASPRFAGKSKYSFKRSLYFAIGGFLSFSKKPLRISVYLGFAIALWGFIFAAILIIGYYTNETYTPGWLTIVVLLCLFSGIQLISIGIIGEYLALIFDEVRNRPLYIVEKKLNH